VDLKTILELKTLQRHQKLSFTTWGQTVHCQCFVNYFVIPWDQVLNHLNSPFGYRDGPDPTQSNLTLAYFWPTVNKGADPALKWVFFDLTRWDFFWPEVILVRNFSVPEILDPTRPNPTHYYFLEWFWVGYVQEQKVSSRDCTWPDPTQAYFWPTVNKGLTWLVLFELTQRDFFDPKGKKLKKLGF